MGELKRAESGTGLYERLLQRLALALDEADASTRLRQVAPVELELRGLTPAELELIRAYMDHDLNWLRGWHAAAEELAVLERMPLPVEASVSEPARGGKSLGRGKPLLKRRQQLHCAICGVQASLLRSDGVQPCSACGSKLFRVGQPR